MPVPESLAPILAVVFVAGLIQGLSGFGSALIAVPLLALMLPVETLVPYMAVLGILVSASNLLHLHRSVRFKPVVPLLGGYVLGTPVGVYFLTRAPESAILGSLGVFIGAYALLSLLGHQPRSAWLREQRVGLGALSGALGAAFSTNGPPIILHVAAHPDWNADRQKATLAVFFLLSSIITVTAHGLSGLVTAEVVSCFLWSSPMILIGTLSGIWLYGRLGEHDYRRLTFALLLATGVLLVIRSGRALI
jgi:uncharacterized membrane protein YfcA